LFVCFCLHKGSESILKEYSVKQLLMSPGARYRETVNGMKTGRPMMTFQSMTRRRMCQKHK